LEVLAILALYIIGNGWMNRSNNRAHARTISSMGRARGPCSGHCKTRAPTEGAEGVMGGL